MSTLLKQEKRCKIRGKANKHKKINELFNVRIYFFAQKCSRVWTIILKLPTFYETEETKFVNRIGSRYEREEKSNL